VQIREPVAVTDENDWLNVAAGQNHTCAIKQDRSSWCWGANSGRATSEGCPLGIDANELDSPTPVGAANDWAQVVTNTFHTCAINRNSELYCWGRNTEGQLGVGDTTLRLEPTLTTSGITVASTGRFSTCAITTYGGISCAGDNASGQLGTGDNERRNRLSPIEVPR
jgi:alpha-tubulin suppressor-like RCC1 family protein